MEIFYNRNKDELLPVMKSKGEKKNIKIYCQDNKLVVSLKTGEFKNGEDSIPVMLKGRLVNIDEGCVFKGRFSYGFYLYTLVILAAVLIVARFAWSAYQKQLDNMILCGIVTVLLVIVIAVVFVKSKKAKELIMNFMNDLNVIKS